jgi:radical SAM superfamily enzyme
MVREAGIELSEYVILGIGGKERSREHAVETARVLNDINPEFIRLRTFLPKINTLLLHHIRKGRFRVLSPHEVFRETIGILQNLTVTSEIHSDHYTNYVNLRGSMPADRQNLLAVLHAALGQEETRFRPVYVGRQ